MLGSGWTRGDGTGALRGALASVFSQFSGNAKSPQEIEIERVLTQSARHLGKIVLPDGKGARITLALHMLDGAGTLMVGKEKNYRGNFEIVAERAGRKAKLGGTIFLPCKTGGRMTVAFDDVVKVENKGRKKPFYSTVPSEVASKGKTLDARIGAYAGLLAARIATEGTPRQIRTHVIELR